MGSLETPLGRFFISAKAFFDLQGGVLATYIHDLKPEIIEFTPQLAVRWYGLAYLLGFLAAWALLKKMSERQLFPVVPDKVSDFVAYGSVLGIFLGGRLGYVLFYMLPTADGRAKIADAPLSILKVWEGGMASHGGILGLTIFAFFYARRHKLSWAALGDGIVCVAPLGVFFGRVANFINGELYGHHTTAKLPWLVKFPGTVFNPDCPENEEYGAIMRVAIASAKGEHKEALNQAWLNQGIGAEAALTAAVQESDAVKTAIDPFLLPRHPSQIYEGLLEGLLLFILLTALRFRFPKLASGILTGLFFLLYALGRIFVEQFRVPDSAMVGILTKGQFYSLFFILIGIGFLVAARMRKLKPS